jgi:hypothetical protein
MARCRPCFDPFRFPSIFIYIEKTSVICGIASWKSVKARFFAFWGGRSFITLFIRPTVVETRIVSEIHHHHPSGIKLDLTVVLYNCEGWLWEENMF